VRPAVRSPTLSTQISDALVRRIVRGELVPGQALPTEEALAEQFDVSRPVIREAVKELAAIGLVESRQGRATRVAPDASWNYFDPRLLYARSEIGTVDETLLELLELRRLIESGAAGLAAQRRTEEDLAAMEAAITEMEATVGDLDQFTDADIRFHDAILRAAGNKLLFRLIQLIAPLLRVGRRMSLERLPEGPFESLRGHQAILAAIGAQDVPGARSAMREHLSWTANLRLGVEELESSQGP